MTFVAESRASSYPIRRHHTTLEPEDDLQVRFRADSFPEPRHLRRLRRELDLDSDLDRKSRYSKPEDAFLQTPEAKMWKAEKWLQRGFKHIEAAEGEVLVSRGAMEPPTPARDVASSATLTLTHIPYTNWTRWSYGKALEITGENLEDLLAYDDLFLDYFNAFLALPVFPQAMAYNRLTGDFDEITAGAIPDSRSISRYDSASGLRYGISDGQRDTMLQWARKERLPLFLSTQLFREFKLCKLLLRPLDDRYSASRGSSHQIRGYSRQSESYVSSLSNSADNSANDGIDDEDFAYDYNASQLFKYQRPGSRALSVPAPMTNPFDIFDDFGGSTETETQATSKTSQSIRVKSRKEVDDAESLPPTVDFDLPPKQPGFHRESTVTFDPETAEPAESKSLHSRRSSRRSQDKRYSQAPISDIEGAFLRHARVLSAPINYDDYMRHPMYRDFDLMFGEDEPEPDGNVYVAFEEDGGASEAQTETDMKNLEGRLKMTFQQMKEQTLGTFNGMEDFKLFLSSTGSADLVDFWQDCEYFKDSMEKFDEIAIVEKRNRLFRDIQDKFKLCLTKEAKEGIAKAASNSHLSHSIFIRTQYDVLRRLRAYWVPRYLMHQERIRKLSSRSPLIESNRWITMENTLKDSFSFFPSINLVSSMPVRPDDVLTYSKTKDWESVSKGGRRLDDRIKSAKYRRDQVQSTAFSGLLGFSTKLPEQRRPYKERFIVALAADKMAGGPFERYLASHPDQSLLSNLLFWQDVTEYGAAEDRAADRLLRMCNAWAIYNRFISEDSPFNVGLSDEERLNIHQALLSTSDFVEATVFDRAKQHACDRLQDVWLRFLKEDLKAFLDCCSQPGNASPPSTADVIKITLTNDEVVIERPRPWLKRPPGTTETQRAQRLKSDLYMDDMDEEKRAELRAKRLEARKEMERERRKAVKAAYKRLKDSKTKKSEVTLEQDGFPSFAEEDKKEDDMDFDEDGNEKKSAKPPPPFHDMTGNKAIMSNFKKYLQETNETKEPFHMVGLFTDIETFLSFGTNKKEIQRREQHGNYIHKTYLDSHSKKKVSLGDKLQSRVPEKERPKTPIMKEIQHSIHSKIDENFKAYLQIKAEEHGMEPGDLVKLSQAELSMRLGSDTGGSWRKGKGRGKGKDGIDREHTYPSVRVTFSKMSKKERKVHFAKEGTEMSMFSMSGTETTYLSSSQDDSSGTTTPGPPGSSQYRRRRPARFYAKTGRAAVSRDDREEFYKALKLSAAGKMAIQMLYFYKYLLKHGEEDNMPLIDKDLFFYIEVQKFKDCSHQYADEEILRRKVQSLIDCFLESITTPTVQIDVPNEIHQKTLRAAQRYVQGKDVFSNIFDEAQFAVFKELLPYWAGFKKTFSPPEDTTKRPVTKYEKMLKKRMENIDNYVVPPNEFHLPSIPEGAIAAFSFSLADGVKLRPATPPSVYDKESIRSLSPASSILTAQSSHHREIMSDNDPLLHFDSNASARGSKIDIRGVTGKKRQSISLHLPGPLSSNLSSGGDTNKSSKKESTPTKS